MKRHINVAAAPSNDNNASLCCLITPSIPTSDDIGIPGAQPKIKKIIFRTVSCDQGWGGEPADRGTYNGSFTWFEAAIFPPTRSEAMPSDLVRLDRTVQQPAEIPGRGYHHRLEVVNIAHPDRPSRWRIQTNVCASSHPKEHTVIWEADARREGEDHDSQAVSEGSGDGAGFINSLTPGDRVAVIARAIYPMWVNKLQHIEVFIYYTI
ncbi:hypothetical protein C8J57DRAFT_1068232 [Mycena rebaudengoi]|nr:hypothetical protein C8J57DRAFT_1068232 [Mycena rebaudengoi]